MPIINEIHAHWILDSRGFPTVSCQVVIDQNGRKAMGQGSTPSGASTGSYEALELRDSEKEFHGKGVNKAIHNINSIIESYLVNRDFFSAAEVDQAILNIDQSSNKSELGANAILAVSMATHRAFANLYNLELWQYLRRIYFSSLPAVNKFPRLMCNILNGGAHADNDLDIQEFMIVPNTGEVETDIRQASEIYHTLKKDLKNSGLSTALGDEGGFAPKFESIEDKTATKLALDLIKKAINDSGYSSINCDLALDAAASEFYNKESNTYKIDKQDLGQAALTDFWADLYENYNILSIEDGFAEDDILGWEIMTRKLGQKMKLIGDDLFVTNPDRFAKVGLANNIANGVLIKLNQIGSVFETCKMINLAKESDYITAISHRSGETTDSFISDLAFASQSEFIKLGAPARGERVAKFNRLLEIKDSLM